MENLIKQLILFAEWLQYNGKLDLPKAQVEKFLKEQKNSNDENTTN